MQCVLIDCFCRCNWVSSQQLLHLILVGMSSSDEDSIRPSKRALIEVSVPKTNLVAIGAPEGVPKKASKSLKQQPKQKPKSKPKSTPAKVKRDKMPKKLVQHDFKCQLFLLMCNAHAGQRKPIIVTLALFMLSICC